MVFSGALEQMLGSARASRAGFGASPKQSSSAKFAMAGRHRQHARRVRSPIIDRLLPPWTQIDIPIPKSRRKSSASIRITRAGAQSQEMDVEIPLGICNCVTGVSGSGKSTLVTKFSIGTCSRRKDSRVSRAGGVQSVTGAHRVGDVVMVDQSMLAGHRARRRFFTSDSTIACASSSPRSRKPWRRD